MSTVLSSSGAPVLLLVDGDAQAAAALADIAHAAGYTPRVVADVDAYARAAWRDAPPAVVIVDLHGARLDGIQVLRILAQRRARAGVVIVGDADRRVLDAAHRLASAHGLHVVAALAKPVDAAQLEGLLRAHRPPAAALAAAPSAVISHSELQRGLDEGELEVHFQPKVATDSLAFTGVEALLRWTRGDGAHVPPEVFIRLAERTGLIVELTRRVIARVCTHCAAWRAAGLDARAAINLSPRSLTDLGLPDAIEAIALGHGVPPSMLVLEVTEGWRSEDEFAMLDVLTRLRLKGFDLSMDDFGTGYSSMLQLRRVPFNELKIAGSFIDGAAADHEARVILESSVRLGHRLGLRVVAEGIERQEEWDLVSALGCDEAQGYFVAHAMSAEALPEWLARWNVLLGK